MGVATGGYGGDVSPPPGSKFQGDIPPEIAIFKEHFMHVFQHFQIFHYFPNKVAETRGEIGIWGWVVLIHLNLSPQSKSVPPPAQWKIRGDAPVREYSGFLANFAFCHL